jgi:HPr kinase/phosphorylase
MQTSIYGSMLNIFDTGVVLTGPAGIGKSECALCLIDRGHQFIADDLINIDCINHKVIARSDPLTKNLLMIREVGLINIQDQYSEDAICHSHPIELIVELTSATSHDDLLPTVQTTNINDLQIPTISLTSTGQNVLLLALKIESLINGFKENFQTTKNFIKQQQALILRNKNAAPKNNDH